MRKCDLNLQKYLLCAIDLDETLLGPDHQISDRNARAVKAVAELGVNVVIASGRMHEATLQYADQLGLRGPIVSYNGALCKLPGSNEEWIHERIPANIAMRIMEYCRNRNLQLNFYYEGKIHSAADTKWLQVYYSRTSSPYVIEPNMIETMAGKEPTKLIIVDSEEFTNSLLPEFHNQFGEQLYVTKTTNEYLEFMPPNANKGTALKVVATRMHIPEEYTLAIGDSYNDVPMLKWAGTGLAVGNAKEELKAVADRIIGRYDEDGVAEALEDIFLRS